MKRSLWVIVAALLLSGCGSDEASYLKVVKDNEASFGPKTVLATTACLNGDPGCTATIGAVQNAATDFLKALDGAPPTDRLKQADAALRDGLHKAQTAVSASDLVPAVVATGQAEIDMKNITGVTVFVTSAPTP
jgi:hypothetical protein